MTSPTIPKGYDAVKMGKELIGCISRKRVSIFEQYQGKMISKDSVNRLFEDQA